MFKTLGLFGDTQCPEWNNCSRQHCLYSHKPAAELPQPFKLSIPITVQAKPAEEHNNQAAPQSASQASSQANVQNVVIPAKRPQAPLRAKSGLVGEPPKKLQKTGAVSKPVAVPNVEYNSTGVPVLKVNAAQSLVAVPVRQAMVKNLFDHFTVLYQAVLPNNPTLAAEHALRQEEEAYKKSHKLTYRNAVINIIASIKKRVPPDSASHASIGTEEEIAKLIEDQKKLENLHLKRAHLEQFIMSIEELKKWGFMTEIPEGPGGTNLSEEGKNAKCDRCGQPFQVKRLEEADECIFHWGKPFYKTINAERMRIYNCCSRPYGTGEGCSKGPHVFYESKPEDLHARHAFSFTRESQETDNALDVITLDCEMIYSTAGMRVARVSMINGKGVPIYDELIRMDDGVEVIDYNTRFSGIKPEEYKKATKTLVAIRRDLDKVINSKTILVGHALDNDLKTLRMVHHQCVDTSILFPHRAGPPYRRALRDLSREHLGKIIQAGGGAEGHSSIEDSIATLNLVRWYVLNGQKTKPKPLPPPPPPQPLQEAEKKASEPES